MTRGAATVEAVTGGTVTGGVVPCGAVTDESVTGGRIDGIRVVIGTSNPDGGGGDGRIVYAPSTMNDSS